MAYGMDMSCVAIDAAMSVTFIATPFTYENTQDVTGQVAGSSSIVRGVVDPAMFDVFYEDLGTKSEEGIIITTRHQMLSADGTTTNAGTQVTYNGWNYKVMSCRRMNVNSGIYIATCVKSNMVA